MARGIGYEEEKAPSLIAGQESAVYDARGNGNGKMVPTLTGDHQNRVTDYTALCVGNGQLNQMSMSEQANTLDTMHDQQAVMVSSVDCRNMYERSEISGTLQSKDNGGYSLNYQNPIRVSSEIAHTLKAKANCDFRADSETYPVQNNVVRRLTPLECERLQGYPSDKKWDVSRMTKDEYIAWNLAEGNIIADTSTGKVYGVRGPGGIPYKHPKELTGSIVNGYRVVSIRNRGTKLQCRVHRVIWIAQNGVIPDGFVIDHINNNKQDNRIDNLQLLTPQENSTKAKNDGLYVTGLDNKATKLDPDLKDEIAYLYEFSELSCRDLAEIYGVSKSRISQIVKEVGWTDIDDWADSKGKKHKAADSPRYKALGNSIALPFWQYLARRICAQYERDITMGSLFDGIGGFPLVFERCGAKAVWASEIEEFPIAVTKKHFPEV